MVKDLVTGTKGVENLRRHSQVEVIHHPYQGKDEGPIVVAFYIAYNPVSFSMVFPLLTIVFLIIFILILLVILPFLLGKRMSKQF